MGEDVSLLRYRARHARVGHQHPSASRHEARREEVGTRRLPLEDPFMRKRSVTRALSHTAIFDFIYDRLRALYLYFAVPCNKDGPLIKVRYIDVILTNNPYIELPVSKTLIFSFSCVSLFLCTIVFCICCCRLSNMKKFEEEAAMSPQAVHVATEHTTATTTTTKWRKAS